MQDFFYNAGCFFIIGTQVVSPVNTDQVVQVVTGGAGATYVASCILSRSGTAQTHACSKVRAWLLLFKRRPDSAHMQGKWVAHSLGIKGVDEFPPTRQVLSPITTQACVEQVEGINSHRSIDSKFRNMKQNRICYSIDLFVVATKQTQSRHDQKCMFFKSDAFNKVIIRHN
jgi:uncharacterized protein (DUF1810 family)